MKPPAAPPLDERRTSDFSAELRARARAWIPSWDLADGERDFGRALLDIAARFNSEVAERLDGAGEKMRRGFLDWLAIRGQAARPARMPVVFKLADAAQTAVLATAPVRLQADASGTSVVFETEKDVRVIPGRLDVLVGVDADNDAFYLPAPGLSDLQPLEPMPTEWLVKSFAAAGAVRVQLDPDTGLAPEMIVEAGGQQYRILQVDKDIVTVDPALSLELNTGTIVRTVTSFDPFGASARNRQAHALYLGDNDLLNIESAATVEILGAAGLSGVTWQYWGKAGPDDAPRWLPLTLAQSSPSATIVLSKPLGTVDPLPIDGRSSRWIRAYAKTVSPATADSFKTDELRIRINSGACATQLRCPPDKPIASPAAEAMANTTPLVLDNVFFPLGKEPRQFDAFYLGSQEAFSKVGATVQLCFEMADPTFSSLSAVREGTFANIVLAGVAEDRALHLFAISSTGAVTKLLAREPMQPPAPGYAGAAAQGNVVALDRRPSWKLPTWSEPDFIFGFIQGFLVAVTAGDAVWVWHENPDRKISGWINFGSLPPVAQTPAPAIDGLVYLGGPPAKLVALRNGTLFVRAWPAGPQWQDAGNLIKLKSIVPVFTQNAGGRLVTSDTAGMVGISAAGGLYEVTSSGVFTQRLVGTTFDVNVRPAAVRLSNGDLVVAALDDSAPAQIVTYHSASASKTTAINGQVVGALEPIISGGVFYVLASLRGTGRQTLLSWAPYAAGNAATPFESDISVGAIAGCPTALDAYVVVPGERTDILVSPFDPASRLVKNANVVAGVVVPESVAALVADDLFVRTVAAAPERRLVIQSVATQNHETLYEIKSPFSANASGPLLAYDLSATLSGTFSQAPDKLTLHSTDNTTAQGDWVRIGPRFYEVGPITGANPRVAVLTSFNGALMPAPGPVDYVRPIVTGGRAAPFMRLDPNGNGNWDVALLNRIDLQFPSKVPDRQRGVAFITLGNKPVLVVLGNEFTPAVVGATDFLIDAAVGGWQQQLGDTSSNPELSWEYWNGKGWWKLDVSDDETLHLKTTGAVRFTIPTDIASSDWAGKTNNWIRARLIGGDYGREKVTVTTQDLGGGKSEQTVQRSTEGIRAPSVLSLHISYALCDGARPAFVLAEDSGAIRDQSEANRTAGAIVEAFVPLALTLGRLSYVAGAVTSSSTDGHECSPECPCQSAATASDFTSLAGAPTPAKTTPATGRSMLIGLSAPPADAPVNVLLLVDEERPHTAFAPMTVEALVGDRFVPIVASDDTRAIGESGVLSMAFVVPPTSRNLFGRTLSWLRLTPKAGGPIANWQPTLRGAYLNAAFASAAETLTRELLGSSDGSPHLVVKLQRPPVLHHTLELRVKEPLGEEERAALKAGNERTVIGNLADLPGDWVLWEQVTDPLDEPPSTRAYALDEATGEVRFGDGLHGMIPPIGRDSIVAFSYQRTEPPPSGSDAVPANTVESRTPLNLVTPVEGVEAVFAADHAAGGAPSEPDDRVLRFGFSRIRHRSRAVTARDMEDLALQSSPDIVQARAFVRRGFTRLVIVMRGAKPEPSAAQKRELRRLLLAAAPTTLSAPNALRIEGPRLRRLRVDLTLRVESLDIAGAVSAAVKKQLARFFDTAIGGTDREGWPVGAAPSAEDVALALLDVQQIDGIAKVSLREITIDGRDIEWSAAVEPAELAMLAEDPIHIQFETAEVLA